MRIPPFSVKSCLVQNPSGGREEFRCDIIETPTRYDGVGGSQGVKKNTKRTHLKCQAWICLFGDFFTDCTMGFINMKHHHFGRFFKKLVPSILCKSKKVVGLEPIVKKVGL